jgi:hypothetical protein
MYSVRWKRQGVRHEKMQNRVLASVMSFHKSQHLSLENTVSGIGGGPNCAKDQDCPLAAFWNA